MAAESFSEYWNKLVDDDGESIYPEPGLAHWCCPFCTGCHPYMSMKQVEEFTESHKTRCPNTHDHWVPR